MPLKLRGLADFISEATVQGQRRVETAAQFAHSNDCTRGVGELGWESAPDTMVPRRVSLGAGETETILRFGCPPAQAR